MRGMDSVTIPGAVRGWVALSKRFGKLPFADLMAPPSRWPSAVTWCPRGAAEVGGATPVLQGIAGFADTFLPWGRAPEVGELFRFPAAARAQGHCRQQRRCAVRRRDRRSPAAFAKEQGGALTVKDLASYQPEWVTPISRDYRGYTLHEIPPNGQGIAALIALGILEKFDLASLPVDSTASQHLQIEAMKLAFADVYRYVSERSTMEVTTEQMLDDAYLASRARLIDMRRAQDFQAGNPVKGGTIYLTAADENGMMVSFIQSNYMGFGSGCVEPHYGISLQNRGYGFSLDAASPNVVAPGKRPFHHHSGLPDQGRPAGDELRCDGRQHATQGHMQTLVRMLDYRQGLQAACDAPRWRFNKGLNINVEAAMNAATVQGLKDLGHEIDVINDSYQDFGAGQFIWRAGNPAVEGYVAASDPRRDGLAAGY